MITTANTKLKPMQLCPTALNALLTVTKPTISYGVRPPMICGDGVSISVQASVNHYCSPKSNEVTEWTTLEVWVESEEEPRAYCPIQTACDLINQHGGFVDWEKIPVTAA